MNALLDFVKEKGALGVDGSSLQEKLKEAKEAAGDAAEEVKEKVAEEEEKVEHDEL